MIKALILLILTNPVYANEQCANTSSSFSCVKYVDNYDADTIKVDLHDVHPFFGKKLSVRLYGIDTPELRTKNKCEKELSIFAKEYTRKALLIAKRIDLKNISKGKYFRLVADVMVDGRSLTENLLNEGFGYEYFGKTKEKPDWCKALDKYKRKPASK